MRRRVSKLMVIVITCLGLTIPALAKTDYQVRQKIQLEQAPIDLLVSSNNKWI